MTAKQTGHSARRCSKRATALAVSIFLSLGAAAALAGGPKSESAAPAPLVPILPQLPVALGPNQTPTAQLKTLKTPFGRQETPEAQSGSDDPLAGFSLGGSGASGTHHFSLQDRLLAPRLYLPGHMVLGKVVQFTVKGKAGSWVALAMADKDSGAKPVMGHKLRLGPDRKVVAAGQIPANGVLVLDLETPVEGDLIGLCLYFEAAIWSKDDMSDTEFASVVSSEAQPSAANGVLIAADTTEKKHGLKLVPDSGMPISARQQQSGSLGLESGKP